MTTLDAMLAHELLPREEQIRLCRLAQAGARAGALVDAGILTESESRPATVPGLSARHRLAEMSLRLVIDAAKRRRRECPGADLDDMVGAGCVALMKSIDGFDPGRGTAFTTYAVWAIAREVGRVGPLRVGSRPVACVGGFGGNGDAPEPAAGGEPPGESEARARMEAEADRLLRRLPARERQILRWRLGLGCERKTLDEIGRRLGVSRARVGQLEKRTIHILRGRAAGLAEAVA